MTNLLCNGEYWKISLQMKRTLRGRNVVLQKNVENIRRGGHFKETRNYKELLLTMRADAVEYITRKEGLENLILTEPRYGENSDRLK